MAKPFSLQELEARVRALTRRGLGTASAVIKHGPLSFDATGRVAYLNDQMLDLSARELSLLECCCSAPAGLVSKDQLVELLCTWGEEVSTTRSRSTSTACARRSSRARYASPRSGAWLLPGEDRGLNVSSAPGEHKSLFGEILDWMLARCAGCGR